MKWLAVVLIGCLATSALARTYPELPDWRAHAEDELSRKARANIVELNAAELAYRQYARADSLLPLLPVAPAVVAGLSPALEDGVRDTLAALLSNEIAAIGQPRARTGVFLLDNAYGGHAGPGIHRIPPGREIYAGVDSAGVYCMMVGTGVTAANGVMQADAFRWLREHRRAGLLGPCTFFARYGAPGAKLAQWLEDGAYAIAEVPGRAWPIEAHANDRTLWMQADLRIRACVAGRDEACSEIVSFARPPAPGAGPATARLESLFIYRGNVSRMLLSELEASFGPERFERFWTSGADVPTAFTAAFGVDIADWMREWGVSHYGVQHAGPGVPAGTLLLSALAVFLAGGLAAAVAARRTV